MVTQLTINGAAIQNIATFYDEINRVFMADEDWKLGNSLDAFDDLLYGGFGALKDAAQIELTWTHFEQSREMLGYAVTREYLLTKLAPGSPYNKKLFEEKLAALESGTGETYFDIILSIIAEHPRIKLIAR